MKNINIHVTRKGFLMIMSVLAFTITANAQTENSDSRQRLYESFLTPPAMSFASMMCIWSCMAFHLAGAPFHARSDMVGAQWLGWDGVCLVGVLFALAPLLLSAYEKNENVKRETTKIMKALFINGSPRKNGNTAQLLKRAMDGAREAGAEVELVNLYDRSLNYKGCMSCFACKVKG